MTSNKFKNSWQIKCQKGWRRRTILIHPSVIRRHELLLAAFLMCDPARLSSQSVSHIYSLHLFVVVSLPTSVPAERVFSQLAWSSIVFDLDSHPCMWTSWYFWERTFTKKTGQLLMPLTVITKRVSSLIACTIDSIVQINITYLELAKIYQTHNVYLQACKCDVASKIYSRLNGDFTCSCLARNQNTLLVQCDGYWGASSERHYSRLMCTHFVVSA